jgi:hypothetical protein
MSIEELSKRKDFISMPVPGQVVLYVDDMLRVYPSELDGAFGVNVEQSCWAYPVYIVNGPYADMRPWLWRRVNEDGTLGTEEESYGRFLPIGVKYKTKTVVIWG